MFVSGVRFKSARKGAAVQRLHARCSGISLVDVVWDCRQEYGNSNILGAEPSSQGLPSRALISTSERLLTTNPRAIDKNTKECKYDEQGVTTEHRKLK